VNDRVKVTHRDHGIMTRPPTSLFSFKCLSPRYLEALKEKTAGSLLRYQTGPKWVTFALAKSYALRRARGEGGKPDPKLEALLAYHAQKLKEKQEMAKWVSSADSYPPVSSPKQNRTGGTPVPPASNSVKLPEDSVKTKKSAPKEETLPKKLLSLKKQTSWSWERMAREFHRVMGEEGPTHTTLFRYASGRVQRPHVLVEQYVRQAIQKLTAELSRQQNRQG